MGTFGVNRLVPKILKYQNYQKQDKICSTLKENWVVEFTAVFLLPICILVPLLSKNIICSYFTW